MEGVSHVKVTKKKKKILRRVGEAKWLQVSDAMYFSKTEALRFFLVDK